MKNMNFLQAGELLRRAALPDGLVVCTLRWAGAVVGCTVSWAVEKGGPKGCPFLPLTQPLPAACRTAFLCSPPARPESSHFSFGNMALQPAQPSN